MDNALQRQSYLFSFLICCVFIIAPLYSQQSPGGEGLAVPYNNWVWIAALMLISAGIFQIILKRTIILPIYWLGMIALPIGLMLSGFINETDKPTQWLFRIGYVIGGFLFFIALFQFKLNRRSFENILYALCAASVFHCFIALCQVLDWHFTSYIPRTATNVPTSIFQQVNVHASYLVSAFFIALYLATSPSVKNRHLLYKLLLITTIVCTTALLLAISSRAALVSFVVSAILMLIARAPAFKKNSVLSLILLGAFLVGLGGGSNLSQGFAKYETKLDVQRNNARTYIYDLSWQTFKQAPFFGHGIGSFEQVFQEAKIHYPDSDKMGGHRYSHPHNELLFWMIEGGISSLTGIFIALIATCLALIKLGWRRALSYCALLFPISFHTQVELPFYLSSALWFLWLTLLFVVHSHRSKVHKVTLSIASEKLLIVSTAAICSLLIGFFIHASVSLAGIVKFMRSAQPGFVDLTTARNNLYHQNYVQQIQFTVLLYNDIANGSKQATPMFIEWATSFIIKRPSPSVMRDLSLAYLYLGQRDKSLQIIRRAAKMYPATKAILLRLEEIETDQSITEFKQNITTLEDRSQSRANP